MKNQVHYQLPLSIEEIRLIMEASEQFRQNNKDSEVASLPVWERIEMLLSIATTEQRYNDLCNQFRAMTGGCEPDDL